MSVNDNTTEFAPFVLPSAKPSETPREMVPLFTIDGTVYKIPRRPSAGLALQYLEKQTLEGTDAAIYLIMTKMLGHEAYDALANHPDLPADQLNAVIRHVEKIVLSGGESGNDGSGIGSAQPLPAS